MGIKVTIELSDADAKHLATYCILRGIKGTLDKVPNDFDYYEEVLAAAHIYERIRSALVQEVFKQQRGDDGKE